MTRPLDWVTKKLRSRSKKQVGFITKFDQDEIIKYNIEHPFLIQRGRLFFGTTPDGSPAVIGFQPERRGWIGYVHDMYFGASEDELLNQEWNVAWVAKSIDDYISRCQSADGFPWDGCAAVDSEFTLLKEV